MKAEGLLLEKLAQPNEAASAGERHSLEREIFYYRLDPLYISLAVFVAAFVCLLLCALFLFLCTDGEKEQTADEAFKTFTSRLFLSNVSSNTLTLHYTRAEP